MNNPRILFRVHAVQRMFERHISVKNVSQTLQSGEIIEDYSAEMSEPGRLLLGFREKYPLHVVISENLAMDEITVITAYIPDPRKWDKDFRSRSS